MIRKMEQLFAAALSVTSAAGLSAASAQQQFRTYDCTDGSQFVVGFFEYDSRAHLQIDGKAVTLFKRPSLSGARYSGGGVTLTTTKTGLTTLKRSRHSATSCTPA